MKKFLILSLSVYAINAIAETSLIIKYKPSNNEINLINNKSSTLNASLRKPLSNTRIDSINKLLSSLNDSSKKSLPIQIAHDQSMAIGAHRLVLNRDLNVKQQEELLKSIKDTVLDLDYVEFDGLAYPD